MHRDNILFFSANCVNGAPACTMIFSGKNLWYEAVHESPAYQEEGILSIGDGAISSEELEKNWCRVGGMHKDVVESVQEMGDACEYRTVRNMTVSGSEDFDKHVNEYVKGIITLNDEQKERVKQLLMDNAKVFSDRPGCTTVYEHHIRPISDKIHVRKSYPVPLSLRDKVDVEIQRMLDLDIIETSDSPYINPLSVVEKKDDSVRLCLDARYLIAVIESDHESPENMEDLLQDIEGVKFMSTNVCNFILMMSIWQLKRLKNL